jgi:GcrA cell cycle regulator
MVQDAEDRQVPHAAARVRTRFDWSAASIALLRRRWAEGASARSIAEELGHGVSRCAVLGKVHRLKLRQPELKRLRWRKEKGRQRRQRRGRSSKRVEQRINELRAAFHALGLDVFCAASDARTAHQHADKAFGPACGLLDLTEANCRWPVGEPGEEGFAFCGAAPFKRHPYCVGHCLIAYRPEPKSDVFDFGQYSWGSRASPTSRSESAEKGPRESASARHDRGLKSAA